MIRTTAIVALIASASAGSIISAPSREMYESRFIDWAQEHNFEFKDGAEFVRRLEVWIENDRYIEEVNSKNLSWKAGHNAYTHMTQEEFKAFFNLGKGAPTRQGLRQGAVNEDLSAYPTSLDWRAKGAVTGVKDQGQCGSCWSFSTTGALEGQYAVKTGSLVSFSEQNLVDCDTTDYGCHGGLMDTAFAWIKKNGGLCTESSYPYVSGTSGSRTTCNTKCTKVSGSTIQAWTDLSKTDSAMVAALQAGPVSVAIEADTRSFQTYTSGVYSDPGCGTNLDHGVLNVGYGTMTGGDYWIVKNSWGTSWGQAGFIYMARNTGISGGQCGILNQASQPSL